MTQHPIRQRRICRHGEIRCINPHCGKLTELYREKICPNCGRRTVDRAGKRRCDECQTLLSDGDPVCPLCGSKQRTTVELRTLSLQNLTEFTHLLHEAQPSINRAECRKLCRSITQENPYRLQFAGKPEQIQPFIRKWNMLGGTAAACLDRETSQRPIVLLHSYNRQNEILHARLLFEAIRKSDCSSLTFGETAAILHRINREEKPFRLCFTSDFDRIDAWVAAWKKLGGTAVRSGEHRFTAGIGSFDFSRRSDSFVIFFP